MTLATTLTSLLPPSPFPFQHTAGLVAMSLAVLRSRALAGMAAPPVTVEVHLANGLPAFTIVGLPEAEVKEAKDRVRAALQNARFEFPARRIKCSQSFFFSK